MDSGPFSKSLKPGESGAAYLHNYYAERQRSLSQNATQPTQTHLYADRPASAPLSFAKVTLPSRGNINQRSSSQDNPAESPNARSRVVGFNLPPPPDKDDAATDKWPA